MSNKRKAYKPNLLMGFLLLAATLLFATQQSPVKANAATVQVTINDKTTDYTTSDTTILLNGSTIASEIPVIQIDTVSLLPAKRVFGEILNCSYSYNDDTKKFTVTGPGGEYKIIGTVDSDVATLNGTAITLPYTIKRGVNQTTGSADFYVPLDFYIYNLGFTYTYNSPTLSVETPYIYSLNADTTDFDTSIYTNALNGVYVSKNTTGSDNIITASTAQTVNAANYTVTSNASEYSVTMAFTSTKNNIGTTEKKIDNGIITSIHVWEDSASHTSYVKIYYNNKYIYTQKMLEKGGKITLSKGAFSLKIMLPNGVSFSKLTTTDQYWKKRFIIVVPGKHKSFYTQNPPYKNSSFIKKISISETSAGNTQIIVTTSSMKGYKLIKGEGYFTVDIGSPKTIYNNIVMLDAGHGGKDNGAKAASVKEKSLCLNILYNKAKTYFDNPTSNVKAYWTRHDDTFINLYQRPKYSKKYNADMFVSLHMNFASSKSAKGTEVYYSKRNNKTAFSGLNSKILAQRMRTTLVSQLNSQNRGVKQAGFVVIKNNTVPAVLVELGFISNRSERAKLKTSTYQTKAAKALYKGISDTFKKYPTTRTK